ncbi:MAG TPA: hypothetical protein VK634_10460, partial [Reyranella sp.]|nr:hypothetical protein [Reyranella sp.]
MADAIVGSVAVDVVPSTKSWNSKLRAQILPQADKLGKEIGDKIAARIKDQIGKGIRDGLGDTGGAPETEGAKGGDKYGSAFSRSLKSKLTAAMRNLPDAKLTADSTDVDRKLADLRGQLKTLAGAKIGIDLKDDEAVAKLRLLKAELAGVGTGSNSISVRTDIAAATAELGAFDAQVRKLNGETATVNVKANTRSAETSIDRLTAKLKSSSGPGTGSLIAGGLATLGPAIGGIAATAVPAVGGLIATMATAAAGAGAFAVVAVPAFKKVQTAAQGLSKANLQLKQAQAAGTSPAVLKAQQSLSKAQAAQGKAATGSSKQQAAAAATVLAAQQRLAAAEKNSPVSKALLKQKQILDQLDPTQKTAVKDYQAFTSAVTAFQKSVEPEVYGTIGGGFKLIADQLPKIAPLTKGAADGFLTLERDADKALNAPFYKNFFSFLQKDAKDSIVDLGKAAGNTFTGIAGLVQAYDPEIAASRAGLVGLTADFSKFGQSAAAGESPAFNQFRDFSHSIAPQVKTDLRDIGGLLGTTLTGLAPSVSPSLKLLDDVAKGLGPVIKPIEAELPGVIKDIDRLVVKVSPLAGKLSAAFSSGAARTIKTVANDIGDLASAANQLPAGVISAAGRAIGVIVTAAAIGKLTGLSKLNGYLLGLTKAAPRAGALEGTASGITTIGTRAGVAAGPTGKFVSSMRGLAGAAGWAVGIVAVGQAIQQVADSQSGTLKRLDDEVTAQKNAKGGGVKGALSNTKDAFAYAGSSIGDKLGFKGGFFNLDAKDKATPKIKAAVASAKDFAALNIPPVDLKAKDSASAVIHKPLVSAKDYGALNLDPVKLKASDKATPTISQ